MTSDAIVVLPRLLDGRRGRWSLARRQRFMAAVATRTVRWAVWLARQAETDLHAARWTDVAVREAARAWRLARLSEAPQRPTP